MTDRFTPPEHYGFEGEEPEPRRPNSLSQLLDASIEVELSGKRPDFGVWLAAMTVEELDEIRRECEAEDGYDELLDAVEAEIGARHVLGRCA